MMTYDEHNIICSSYWFSEKSKREGDMFLHPKNIVDMTSLNYQNLSNTNVA